MSFYRNILVMVVAAAIGSPAFADNSTTMPADAGAPVSVQASASSSSAMPAAAGASVQVDLNKASVKDLMKVKVVNAAKARASVDYRKKNGDFKTVDDLAKVKGFTKMKPDALKAIEGQVSVN